MGTSRTDGWKFPGGPVVRNPAANAGAQVQSLVWEDATCYGATKLVHNNTGPACLQPMLYNKRSHCNRNLGMASKSRRSSLELEKACV